MTITYPTGNVVTRGFDDAGRLNSVQDWLTPKATTFGYDSDGNWTTTSYANGVSGTRTLDNADRLMDVS